MSKFYKISRFNESFEKKRIRSEDIQDIFAIMSDDGYRVNATKTYRQNVLTATEGNLKWSYSTDVHDIDDEVCIRVNCVKGNKEAINLEDVISIKKDLEKKISIYSAEIELTNVEINQQKIVLGFILTDMGNNKRHILHDGCYKQLSHFFSDNRINNIKKWYNLLPGSSNEIKQLFIDILNQSNILNLSLEQGGIKLGLKDNIEFVKSDLFRNRMNDDDVRGSCPMLFSNLKGRIIQEAWVFYDIVIFIADCEFDSIAKNKITKEIRLNFNIFDINQIESGSPNVLAFKLNQIN